MDFGIFTQKDLSYLDDIMPEFIKRSKEDGTNSEDIEEINSGTKTDKPIVNFLRDNIKNTPKKSNHNPQIN